MKQVCIIDYLFSQTHNKPKMNRTNCLLPTRDPLGSPGWRGWLYRWSPPSRCSGSCWWWGLGPGTHSSTIHHWSAFSLLPLAHCSLRDSGLKKPSVWRSSGRSECSGWGARGCWGSGEVKDRVHQAIWLDFGWFRRPTIHSLLETLINTRNNTQIMIIIMRITATTVAITIGLIEINCLWCLCLNIVWCLWKYIIKYIYIFKWPTNLHPGRHLGFNSFGAPDELWQKGLNDPKHDTMALQRLILNPTQLYL